MKCSFKQCAIAAAFSVALAFAQEGAEGAQPEAGAEAAAEMPAEPVQEMAAEPEPAPAPEPTPEPVPVPVPTPAVAVKEPSEIKYHLGARVGVGYSGFRNHKGLAFGNWAIMPEAAFNLGFGVAFGIELSDLVTITPGLQYTLYRANGDLVMKSKADFYQMHEISVTLHTIEVPILANFNLGGFYAEVGPQMGFNTSAKIYKDNVPFQPRKNVFAFGPAIGGGIKMGDMLIGARGYLGVLEYADKSNGKPWTFQVGLTHFFF